MCAFFPLSKITARKFRYIGAYIVCLHTVFSDQVCIFWSENERKPFYEEQRHTRGKQCYTWLERCYAGLFMCCFCRTVEFCTIFSLFLKFSIPSKFPVMKILFLNNKKMNKPQMVKQVDRNLQHSTR